MSRLETAYDHTVNSEKEEGSQDIPIECVYQWKFNNLSCSTADLVYNNQCNAECPLDRVSVFDKVLEKLCLD